jgi:hypothetical protein
MTRDIATMFYENGGYVSDSSYAGQDNYISYDYVTATFIPQGVLRLNSACDTTASVDYTSGSISSGALMDDLIIAELALSAADSQYNTVHINPVTGKTENIHYEVARRYMLDMYGVSDGKRFVLPREALMGETGKPGMEFEIATLSS